MTDPLIDQIARLNPVPEEVAPPLDGEQMLERVTRQSRSDSGTGGSRRAFVAAVAAAVVLLTIGGWFAATNNNDAIADDPAEVITAQRVRVSAGQVTVAAFGGMHFTTTEPAEIVQDPMSIVITSSQGAVRLFQPASTAAGAAIADSTGVIDALRSEGYEIEMLAPGLLAGETATRFRVGGAPINAGPILLIEVQGGVLSWSPVPDAVLAVGETRLGLLVAVLEPTPPGNSQSMPWGVRLLESIQITDG